MGVSPITFAAITGFALIPDVATTVFSTSPQVVGMIYAADYEDPTPANLITAIGDMQAAYTDCATRPLPDYSELASGNIGGLTLSSGLYFWSGTVTISADTTLSGSADDVWIFQIEGDLTTSTSTTVTLSGGAQAKNIFWQVAGQVTLAVSSHFEGVILCATAIVCQTDASMNGRALAQTAVTLDQNVINGLI